MGSNMRSRDCLGLSGLVSMLSTPDFAVLALHFFRLWVPVSTTSGCSCCICKLISWDWTRSCAVASSHLWMFWALTLDALTPGFRHRLRLKMATVIMIVFPCAVAKALLSIELLYWTHWTIQDSVLLDIRILGRPLKFHVQSFLLSRFLTILVWCSRLLWRLCTRRDENELMMLLGQVEYNYRLEDAKQNLEAFICTSNCVRASAQYR